jgi:hypothetical protein
MEGRQKSGSGRDCDQIDDAGNAFASSSQQAPESRSNGVRRLVETAADDQLN